MHWDCLSREEIHAAVSRALAGNVSYRSRTVLGYPGSFLDQRVFDEAPFIDGASFLRTLMENPNHIGCHTLGTSEGIFAGTQALELDLLRICAEEILGAEAGSYDGYVATGGTESNIQALWAYRNAFRADGVPAERVRVLFSSDTHYSVPKGCDLLGLQPVVLPVTGPQRAIDLTELAVVADRLWREGIRHLVLVLNMGTTMFGTVDAPDRVLDVLDARGFRTHAHVDAAFGGFIYPFTAPHNRLSFRNPRLGSFTLDAHKMLQAPYGTGIHLIRKGFVDGVTTPQASYVAGLDNTLCGSRSGANAVAVWMILMSYGSVGGSAFVHELLRATDALCARLDERGLRTVRNPSMNLVAIDARDIPAELAREYHLVPDCHDGRPDWWKIVVMEHIDSRAIARFILELDDALLAL